MKIILDGVEFIFSPLSELVPKDSYYDLELIEPDFDQKTAKFIFGGVDTRLKLPREIEQTISRTSLLPVAKIFKDENGNQRLTAYFD